MKRYEIKYATKGKDDKTFWTRCGTAFENKQGNGFNIVLDAIPTARDEKGQIRLSMFEPKPAAATVEIDNSTAQTYSMSDDSGLPF